MIVVIRNFTKCHPFTNVVDQKMLLLQKPSNMYFLFRTTMMSASTLLKNFL